MALVRGCPPPHSVEKNEAQRGVVLAQPQSDGAETPTPTADPKFKSVPSTGPGVGNSTLRNPFFWVMTVFGLQIV